jgi:hypothetical protein
MAPPTFSNNMTDAPLEGRHGLRKDFPNSEFKTASRVNELAVIIILLFTNLEAYNGYLNNQFVYHAI